MPPLRSLRAQWDRILGSLLVGGGSLAVVGALLAIAGSQNQADRLSFLASGIIGGVFCATIGVTLLLSAHFQDVWRRANRGEAPQSEIALPPSLSKEEPAGTTAVPIASRTH